jgi:hypothetical protein
MIVLRSSVKSGADDLYYGRWWIALYVIRTLSQLGLTQASFLTTNNFRIPSPSRVRDTAHHSVWLSPGPLVPYVHYAAGL